MIGTTIDNLTDIKMSSRPLQNFANKCRTIIYNIVRSIVTYFIPSWKTYSGLTLAEIEQEPLLRDDASRGYVMLVKPEFQDIWDQFITQRHCFWTPDHLAMGRQDRDDFDQLPKETQHFVATILAFFAASDGLVNSNLQTRFLADFKNPETLAFYSIQAAIETIHAETYVALIQQLLGSDQVKLSQCLNALEELPAVRKKGEWVQKWINNGDVTVAERLVAFAAVEGIFFSGSFAVIFWLKQKYPTKHAALVQSNEWICRDEAIHCKTADILFRHMNKKPAKRVIYEIMESAVKIELEFMASGLQTRLDGMNIELMTEYIQHVTNKLLVRFDCEPKWNVTNPFPFMENLGLLGKTDMFQRRITEYKLGGADISTLDSESENTDSSSVDVSDIDDF